MKRILTLALCLLLVAASLCACAPDPAPAAGSEPEKNESAPADDYTQDEIVQVDPAKIVVSDEIFHPSSDLANVEIGQGHIANSYYIAQEQSYEDRWFRTYQSYLPRFTDEIELGGADAIKVYFEEAFRLETDAMALYMQTYGIGDTLFNAATELEHYYLRDYAVDMPGPYLAVTYTAVSYIGGAHSSTQVTADNFDMRTGEKLSLFSDWDAAIPVLNAEINERITQNVFEPVDLAEIGVLPVRLSADGVVFIFNEYVIAPYSEGCIEITVPYAELDGLLAIEPPAEAA